MAQRRIGIMGGSFNPIHRRHLQIAAIALTALQLDQVLFIPNGNPPHKQQELADAAHRFEMTRLAVIPYENFIASDIEVTRDGVIYTVDTLNHLHQNMPNSEFICLIGEDTMYDLTHWRKPEEVFQLCSFAVCPRHGKTLEIEVSVQALQDRGAHIRFLPLEPLELSASDIRLKIATGEPVDALLTPEVYEYIRLAGLYGCPPLANGAMQYYAMLKQNLNEKRLLHSLAVAHTAKLLAEQYGLNAEDCELAGLLHDCAKYMDINMLQTIVRDNQLAVSDIELQSNALLHGPVGAVIAKTDYGINNPEILTAIASHTTGCVGMSEFDMIIYLADKIEPYRHHIQALSDIRSMADIDLYQATYQMMLHSKQHVQKKNLPIHPQTDQIIQWMHSRIRERREQRS